MLLFRYCVCHLVNFHFYFLLLDLVLLVKFVLRSSSKGSFQPSAPCPKGAKLKVVGRYLREVKPGES
jgi:hypothetical protein